MLKFLDLMVPLEKELMDGLRGISAVVLALLVILLLVAVVIVNTYIIKKDHKTGQEPVENGEEGKVEE